MAALLILAPASWSQADGKLAAKKPAAGGAAAAKTGGAAKTTKDAAAAKDAKASKDAKAKSEGTSTEAAAEDRLSIGQIITWGGEVGYFIIGLSVVTVFLILLQIANLREGRFCPRKAQRKYAEMLRARNVRQAAEFAMKDRSLLGKIMAVGLGRMRGGYEEMEQVMSDVAEDEAMRQEQGVGYFGLLAAVSPLCGLLGTVIGMIIAFNEIAIKGVVTPKELADPIQKALVTTAFGLLVAIPNVVAFTFFRNKLQKIMAEVGIVVEDLMTPFRGLKAGEAAAPVLAPVAARAEEPSAAAVAASEPRAKKPQASAEKPEAAAGKPEAAAKKPEAAAGKPEAAAKKPQASAEKPEATAGKPEATAEKPEAAAKKPEATAKKPETGAETPGAGDAAEEGEAGKAGETGESPES